MMMTKTDTLEVELEREMTKAVKAPVKAKAPRIVKPPFNVVTDANGDRFVDITNQNLVQTLRDCTDLENLWDKIPRLAVESLFDELPALQSHLSSYGKNASLTRLVRFLETEYAVEMERIQEMLKNGVASFGALRLLLKPGTEVVIQGPQMQGAKIAETEFHASFFGPYLNISYDYITTNGKTFSMSRENTQIYAYRGVKAFDALSVMPIKPDIKHRLTERGKIFQRLGVGSHYQQYTGHMHVVKWWDYTPMRASGRIMVDRATHDQFKDAGGRHRLREDNTSFTVIPDDQLWMTEPYLNGFSFVTKQWGRFLVEDITDIEFRDEAYTQLVLDAEKKAMVRALVEDSSSGFSDIISGKGGGCIFLLHGEPGTGKTLTAEAVSELLHRPLYSVSVGELGTNTEALEKNLRQILDVAQIWNAVILIDEADIFLEKRTSGDILRNAMVGIFLRLLEYHQGVMFLTTNRVGEFDSAFHSRISVAMRYAALNMSARTSIWQNLLAAAGIEGLDPSVLAVHDVNGRQIKNTIRLAQSLARQEGVAVAPEHITRCLDVSRQFMHDIA